MARPHLGLILPNYGGGLDAERLASAAVAAERAGFDSGWVTDHVVVPPEHAPIYGTIAEALVSLGFLAGATCAAVMNVAITLACGLAAGALGLTAGRLLTTNLNL